MVGSGAYGGPANPAAQMVMLVIFGLIGLIYPICLVVFMRKPHVINACTK
jgi:hypothetical protein